MPGCLANRRATRLDRLRIGILDEDVRELVIGQCPGFAGGEVEVLAVFHLADFQQAGFAEDAVGVGHVVDWRRSRTRWRRARAGLRCRPFRNRR